MAGSGETGMLSPSDLQAAARPMCRNIARSSKERQHLAAQEHKRVSAEMGLAAFRQAEDVACR